MDDLDFELDTCLEAARGLVGQSEDAEDLWEANELCNRALMICPESAEAWLVKGQVQSALGDDLAALACIEKSLVLEPTSGEANYWNAAVLADLERYDEALTAAELTFASLGEGDDGLREEVYYEKAIILDALGETRRARATFEEGLARYPDSAILKAGLEPLRRERLRRAFKVIPGGLR